MSARVEDMSAMARRRKSGPGKQSRDGTLETPGGSRLAGNANHIGTPMSANFTQAYQRNFSLESSAE